ncbi:hypothetical protein BU24DRAFT_21881 [Aaosphaeria arxii CBS 175.79]|uniref:Uncharacterized protein n=1 Tax=Aaosphaeria arxii CBS 175.79 TaxID=1450172 RepID=A0A6A5Y9M5_9PLEO|nr:uncharacterized protein BU24DRAFT_21881 [Aaosphaeria arxii CBS 175.79]KAF2021510.1 hypothetical protein BU24DRAFT_21881 [Aaosphaeria arxii CBS 175.79]
MMHTVLCALSPRDQRLRICREFVVSGTIFLFWTVFSWLASHRRVRQITCSHRAKWGSSLGLLNREPIYISNSGVLVMGGCSCW